jgi:hypothetical protein
VNKVRVLANMFRKINHFLLGIEEIEVVEKKLPLVNVDNDEDHAVIKSIN